MWPYTANWRKSSYSTGSANCVEMANGAASTAIRDTKHRDLSALFFDAGEWWAFLRTSRGDLR